MQSFNLKVVRLFNLLNTMRDKNMPGHLFPLDYRSKPANEVKSPPFQPGVTHKDVRIYTSNYPPSKQVKQKKVR